MRIKIIFILFIVSLILIINEKIENYDSQFKFNEIFLILEDKLRLDLTIPFIHNLSNYRSTYLYNYLFNYSKNSIIEQFKQITLEEYLNKICFVNNSNLVEPILDKINTFLIDYYNCDTIIDKFTYVSNFIDISKKFHKLKFKEDVIKYLNQDIPQLNNYIIFQKIISSIIDIQDDKYYSMNIKDAILNLLLDNNLLTFETNKNYDDFDLLFESIDQLIVDRITSNFNSMYTTVLNFSLNNINNLYYNGNINDFNFNMDFC